MFNNAVCILALGNIYGKIKLGVSLIDDTSGL